MNTDFERIRQIFLAIVDQPSAQWDALVDQACGNDPELRQKVALLLEAHAEEEGILDRNEAGKAPTGVFESLSEAPGTQIGPYKLLQQIGEGGMGTVYMAEQTQPVQRKVALKVIKAGMDSHQVIARFEAERQALALMDHPNIAKVLDAGTTDSHRPYFVMELVKGVPITRYCDQHHLTPRQRLELFVPVCQAIQHAHHKGIIHRDLKPSNVLIALYDDKPVPKVIDFGVAKATGQQLTEQTLHTGFGAVVGTVEYMSPEQASFNQLDVDTRSDIYSLGVLLYELLAGSPPFTKKELEKAGMLEMLRVIREQEPSKPSTKLSTAEGLPTLAANRGTEPAKLTKLVRGELDWIVMKALEKDRSRRYETANGFVMDLQRYLADEPVQACPPSAGYRLRKFVRRNKVPVAAVSLVLLALVAGTLVSTWQAIRATQAEKLAQNRLEAENQARQEAVANLQKAYEAVDQMLTRVGEERLKHEPGMELVRKALLEDALRFYRDFLQQQSADPGLRLETAKAWRRVGDIHYWLSEYVQAEKEYPKSIDLLNQLIAEFPEEPSYQAALAESYWCLCNLQRWLGQPSQAEQSIRRALGLFQNLASKHPSVHQYELEAIHAQNALGIVLIQAKRTVHADETLRSAGALLADFDRNYPGIAAQRLPYDQVEGMIALGNLLRSSGRPAEAGKVYAEAVPLMDKLLAVRPTSAWFRLLHADLHVNRGRARRQLGRFEEAEESFKQALAIDEKLVGDFPSVPRYQHHRSAIATELKALRMK